MLRSVFSNKIEIICGIHESLYFLSHKSHHDSLSASRVLLFRLTRSQTRLIHRSNLCSSYIGPLPFALLSIAGFLPTLRLFVAFSFTIGAKDLFLAVFFRNITLLKLSSVGQVRDGRDGLGPRSRLGQSLFAIATKSCIVSGTLHCSRVFCCIGSSNPAKKSITSILAGSLASSPICILRILNCRTNVSSDLLDAFFPCTQSSHEVWTRRARSPKVDPENL